MLKIPIPIKYKDENVSSQRGLSKPHTIFLFNPETSAGHITG
jgi:hypothetical protein